jgi:tetratricopeptide (TPR) repeat protein
MVRHMFELGLAKRQHEYGLTDPRTAAAARDLGLYLRESGEIAAARQALTQALTSDEATLGRSSAQTLLDAADLASVSAPGESEPLWSRAAQSPDAVLAARAFSALGEIRDAVGDRSGAIAFYRKALAKEETVAGKSASRVAVRLNALALVSEPPAAIPLLERALSINRGVWGEVHPETATTEVNLCGELLAAGRVPEAVHMGVRALAGFEATLGADHPRTAAAASTLADAFAASGSEVQAEKLYRRALSIDERAYGSGHPETLADVKNLATFLRDSGRIKEAAELERRLTSAPR